MTDPPSSRESSLFKWCSIQLNELTVLSVHTDATGGAVSSSRPSTSIGPSSLPLSVSLELVQRIFCLTSPIPLGPALLHRLLQEHAITRAWERLFNRDVHLQRARRQSEERAQRRREARHCRRAVRRLQQEGYLIGALPRGHRFIDDLRVNPIHVVPVRPHPVSEADVISRFHPADLFYRLPVFGEPEPERAHASHVHLEAIHDTGAQVAHARLFHRSELAPRRQGNPQEPS